MALTLKAARRILAYLRARLLLGRDGALVNVHTAALITLQPIAFQTGAYSARRRRLALVLAEGLGAGTATLRAFVVAIDAVRKAVADARHVHTLAIMAVEEMRLTCTSRTHV